MQLSTFIKFEDQKHLYVRLGLVHDEDSGTEFVTQADSDFNGTERKKRKVWGGEQLPRAK